MRAISSILMVAMLSLCIVRVHGECTNEIYGTVQDGETAYAACDDIYDGFKSALCSDGQYQADDTTACLTRSVAVFSYGISAMNWFVGDAVTVSLITDGDKLNNYQVTPDLPAGLALNPSDGTISGQPTVATATATYTVSAGIQTTEVEITISNVICPAMDSFPETVSGQTASSTTACPEGMQGTATRVCNNGHFGDINTSACTLKPTQALSYSPSSINVKVGEPVFTKPSFTNTATSFTISPSLPAGLNFSQQSGAISGSSAAAVASATYTISASNASGASPVTATVTIVIGEASCAGLVNDSNQAMITPSGSSMTLNCPDNHIGSAYRLCTNGVYSSEVDYAGCNPSKPTSFNYAPNTFIINIGEEFSSGRPFFHGIATYFSISPALPEGITLDSATGVISGSHNVAVMYQGTVKAKPREDLNVNYEASTSITIQTITPSCDDTEDFHTTVVGSTAKFACPAGYEGVMSRKCVADGARAKWALADVHCQAEQDYTFVIICAGIFVVCLIVLLVGCSVKASRNRSKGKKTLPSTKTAPKAAAPKAAAKSTTPKPANKVTI